MPLQQEGNFRRAVICLVLTLSATLLLWDLTFLTLMNARVEYCWGCGAGALDSSWTAAHCAGAKLVAPATRCLGHCTCCAHTSQIRNWFAWFIIGFLTKLYEPNDPREPDQSTKRMRMIWIKCYLNWFSIHNRKQLLRFHSHWMVRKVSCSHPCA